MMAEILSDEQALQEHIRDMGPELGPVYDALWNEAVWLHAKWDQYVLLYGHSPERVALLNKAAAHLSWVIQETMHDEILLHMTRLTDRRKDTLSLRRLLKRGVVPDAALASELKTLVETAENACQSAKAARDQRIAHMNYARALKFAAFDPNPSRTEVKAALRAIRAVLNRLAKHYCQSEARCEHFYAGGRDADALIHYLARGLRAEEQQMERFLQGKPLPEDFEPANGV
jgi:hypothetical protein